MFYFEKINLLLLRIIAFYFKLQVKFMCTKQAINSYCTITYAYM